MIFKSTILTALILFCFFALPAQQFILPTDVVVNGYASSVSGTDFSYHSPIPGTTPSLLVRATDGTDQIEWLTETSPSIAPDQTAAFVWMAAVGSSPGKGTMRLSINGSDVFEFFTLPLDQLLVKRADGSSLTFYPVMTDQYGDRHGYMMLRLPAGSYQPGKPLKLTVTGGNSHLTSWYMTFKVPIVNEVTFTPFPAVLHSPDGPRQLVQASVFWFDAACKATFRANGTLLAVHELKFGYNSLNLGLPVVEKSGVVTIDVEADGFSRSTSITLEPVRRWTIDFIQHSHTDIGYTRSQTEILAEHLRYIDYALDYCDATDALSPDARFRWTCEASWAVDEYLKCRPPHQINRLIQRVNEGRIEVTGMYFNFNEIADEQILASSVAAVARIKAAGIDVNLAMQNDVNGIGWCMADYFSKLGVRYLNMGTHGHRALICFDRPTMFWWESPSGNKMLAFRAEHYMTGNTVLDIQTGDIQRFGERLLTYLVGLQATDYPYDLAAIQHSGYLTDNSPPSTTASNLIRDWNELYEWPKLRTSVASSFFEEMEQRYGSAFPVIRGAWPDWWSDGCAASAREVAVTRQASAAFNANITGMAMAAMLGYSLPASLSQNSEQIASALLFYTEHTTGYSESVREPLSQPTMEQRALKESYAWEAHRRAASLGEETMGLLQSGFKPNVDASLLVFNTLNWARNGLATVYIDHQWVPQGTMLQVFDAQEKKLPVQPLTHRSDGTYWAIGINEIAPFGFSRFSIKVATATPEVTLPRKATLENRWYLIEADTLRGGLQSLWDKDMKQELIDTSAQYRLGEFILENLSNREQLEAKRLDRFTRESLDTLWFDSRSEGEIWNTLRFFGESKTAVGPRGFSIEFRLFNHEKRLDVVCSIVKKSIESPESFYLAFPFALPQAHHFVEVAGGVMEAGKDQIVGSSNDWYTMQHFTALRNTNQQIVMSSREMPLLQIGAINTGRFSAGAVPQSTHLFSWPMNNYWTTNFNADQRGGHTWSYQITSATDASNTFATQFGWGNQTPFLTRVLPGGGDGNDLQQGSLISGWPPNVVMVNMVPAADGHTALIHLRETDGKKTTIHLFSEVTHQPLRLVETNVNGEPLTNGSTELEPNQSAFFQINLQ